MRVYSLAYYRHPDSGYESPDSGSSQGVFFQHFLPSLLRAYYAVFPDWELRIHHDLRVMETPYWPVLEELQANGQLRLVNCGEAPSLCGAMLWRCLPFWDEQVELFACRDIDSLPMPRERIMLEEFADSDLAIHAILDSESHTGPLMGGMCAFKGPAPAENLDAWIDGFDLREHGSDQDFLNDRFRLHSKILIHQRHELARYPDAHSRPAAPQSAPGDFPVYHLGAGYPQDHVSDLYPNEALDELERRLLP